MSPDETSVPNVTPGQIDENSRRPALNEAVAEL